MTSSRASTLHFRRPGSLAATTRWWSHRPWAHQLSVIDTAGYLPGRHNVAPLLEPSRRKRARPTRDHDSMWHRPLQAADRRGLEAFAAGRQFVQLPASLQVVAEEEALRLDEARARIQFQPRGGFLHSTPVGPLRSRRTDLDV